LPKKSSPAKTGPDIIKGNKRQSSKRRTWSLLFLIFKYMTNDIRIVPVQKLCLLCPNELQDRDGVSGLFGHLCRECLQLMREQVFRELEQRPKIVRV
jgi:hypothetical protein